VRGTTKLENRVSEMTNPISVLKGDNPMPHKVLIRRCSEYDAVRIAGIIQEGMEELGVRPKGKILLKPNVVLAHPELFPHAFTRKEFLDGVLTAVKTKAESVQEISVGERSGITIPTRYNFKQAGYPKILKKHGVKPVYFEECKQVEVPLRHKDRLRDSLFVPQPIAECDFLINLPKFKAHPWTRLTLSLKNFIGLQDDRHRLVDHTSFLEHKITDLQEIIQPKFIAIDGIIAGQKMMLTPTPFPLGAIIMGTNSCAVDTVGCHMVNVSPENLIHLKMAAERGLGPMSLEEIELGGDYPLEEIQEKTKNFEFCLERIDDYFAGKSNLRCTVGTFPEKHSPDYCWGGCPGALQEAMHILRDFYPQVDQEMKKIHYVIGHIEGPLNLAADEKVIFAGNCTRWHGRINGKEVRIDPEYKTSREVDHHKTKSNDLIGKLSLALCKCFLQRKAPYVQMKGCTLSVAEHVNYLSSIGGIKNPNLDPRLAIPVTLAYWQMQANRLLNRLR
jgi:uncharacterized protein (DUF362 family)